MLSPSTAQRRVAWRKWSGQFAGFLAIGAVNTLLTFMLYLLLIQVVSYRVAYSIAFVAGILFALVANARLFVRSITAASAARFFVFYVFSYIVSLGVVVILVEGLHVPTALAPLGAIAIMIPLNFFGTRYALGRA
jgi:putative flippase GtrA